MKVTPKWLCVPEWTGFLIDNTTPDQSFDINIPFDVTPDSRLYIEISPSYANHLPSWSINGKKGPGKDRPQRFQNPEISSGFNCPTPRVKANDIRCAIIQVHRVYPSTMRDHRGFPIIASVAIVPGYNWGPLSSANRSIDLSERPTRLHDNRDFSRD